MTREGVSKIVRDQVRDYSKTELRIQIQHEVTKGALHGRVLEIAAQQARQVINKAFAPRKLSELQKKQIIDAVHSKKNLATVPFFTVAPEGNVEAVNYAFQIRDALLQAGMTKSTGTQNSLTYPVNGVAIYYQNQDPKTNEATKARAEELRDCLTSAGISVRLIPGPIIRYGPIEVNTTVFPLSLWVGPADLSAGK